MRRTTLTATPRRQRRPLRYFVCGLLQLSRRSARPSRCRNDSIGHLLLSASCINERFLSAASSSSPPVMPPPPPAAAAAAELVVSWLDQVAGWRVTRRAAIYLRYCFVHTAKDAVCCSLVATKTFDSRCSMPGRQRPQQQQRQRQRRSTHQPNNTYDNLYSPSNTLAAVNKQKQ